MIESRIFVSGIRASGRHGANPGEKDTPQEFVVDLDVAVHTGDDVVAETADYREMAQTVRRLVEDSSFDLLEHLADAIARAVLATDHVARVKAVVHKPAAARSVGVDGHRGRRLRRGMTQGASPGGGSALGAGTTPSAPVRAYLGLGSNVGDRLATLQNAVDLLSRHEGVQVLRSSRVYETEPVGGPAQDDFLNAVVEVETTLSPAGLLLACRATEDVLGRVRPERWGPRTIDVDILTYGERAVHDEDLEIPHPRMRERAFVLVPLLELEPDPILPGGTRLLDVRLEGGGLGVRPEAPPLRVRPAR